MQYVITHATVISGYFSMAKVVGEQECFGNAAIECTRYGSEFLEEALTGLKMVYGRNNTSSCF